MGMSTGGGGGTGKNVQSEINVTPLIDVLLVLLIIFMLVMPIMMKMETLQIPRKLDENEQVETNLGMLTIYVKADLSIDFNDGLSENPTPIAASDMVRTLKPKLEAMANAGQVKVVFVDFDRKVPWGEVVNTMDTIRGMASDINHDEIKVALKVKDEAAPPP
ncbi:MAG: biopolymer transporter ExbD [Kofleriaceae bacterium]